MLSDFIHENLPTVDYRLKIQSFNLLEPQQEYVEIIAAYRTPNTGYISPSVRNLDTSDVQLKTLTYIIEECHQCTEKQKYEAAIIALHKFYQVRNDVALIKQLKQKIMYSFDYSDASNSSNFAWADMYSDGTKKIFYLLYITIGSNKLIKFGITSNRLRNRLAVLKSDINSHYNKALHIEPLLIVDCVDNEQFEKQVRTLILENGCKPTNYNFRGSSEVFSSKCKDALMGIALDIAEKYGEHILFNASNSSDSIEVREEQVIITQQKIVSSRMSWVCGDI